jgi:methionyl-tRNA formyltransferase
MNPWPAAFTDIPLASGEVARLKIFAADAETGLPALPGTILHADTAGIDIATGDGAMRVHDVQGEGRRRMSAGEWLRGHAVALGGICGGAQ